MGLEPIIMDIFHLLNLHFGIHRTGSGIFDKWYHETSEKLPFYLRFRLRFQLRPNRSGKSRIPHLPAETGSSRGILDFCSVRVNLQTGDTK